MTKKIKVQYNKDIIYHVEPFVWELCERVYELLLLQEALPGTDPIEKSIKWFAEEYKGGVGLKQAKEIVRKNSLFYFIVIEAGYQYVLEQIKKHGAGKRPKKKGKGNQADYNAEFVYNMTEYYVRQRIKVLPKGMWAEYYKSLKEKYPDKEKRDKRLGDRAQGKAYVMRALLKALEEKGELPKTVFAK